MFNLYSQYIHIAGERLFKNMTRYLFNKGKIVKMIKEDEMKTWIKKQSTDRYRIKLSD